MAAGRQMYCEGFGKGRLVGCLCFRYTSGAEVDLLVMLRVS